MTGVARDDGVAFVLRPDWLHDTAWVAAVHNYVHAFTADAPHVLWLAVDRAVLSIAEAVELLRPIVARLGARPFAAVTLADDPAELPPRARRVELPSHPRELWQWTPAVFHEHAERAR